MIASITKKPSDIVRKFGLAGFAFFFIKGLLWLIAPFVIAAFI